jgi:hypothetical protein
MEIRVLNAHEARAQVGALADVLLDCVEGGASVSFMAGFSKTDSPSFSEMVAAGVDSLRRNPEVAPVELPPPFSQNEGSVTVRDLWTSLQKAASDHRIHAIVLKPQSVTARWAKLQEVRQELLDFKTIRSKSRAPAGRNVLQ